ncbi:MAG TPA: hypothetical protein PLB90_12050 [Opitutaceae bacterium]|nr:hypothetical protein [Opitutaceae bacterium]
MKALCFLAVAESWTHLLAMTASALVLCGGFVKYAFRRARDGRKKNESWTSIATDGGKTTTGNVWADAALFLGVILLGAAFVGYYLHKMKSG